MPSSFIRSVQLIIKTTIDFTLGLVATILLLPLMFVVALLIKLDDGGPVFFRQERIGKHGRVFKIWKFRSMVVNADELLDASGKVGLVNRVTRCGRFLRKTSLDEIPQLINVIHGEMSLVGPRATLPTHWPRYTAEQKKRARMKPGITGLAQVKGRNTLPWSKRIEYDNEYIDKYSLWLDLIILLKTIKVVIFGEGIVLDRNIEKVDDLAPSADAESPNNSKCIK